MFKCIVGLYELPICNYCLLSIIHRSVDRRVRWTCWPSNVARLSLGVLGDQQITHAERNPSAAKTRRRRRSGWAERTGIPKSWGSNIGTILSTRASLGQGPLSLSKTVHPHTVAQTPSHNLCGSRLQNELDSRCT